MGEYMTFAVALLTITNPIGTMAIYAGMVSDMPRQRQLQTARTAAIAILVILLVVTWTGEALMRFFGVSIPAFEAAGGLIIAVMGLSMLHGKPSTIHHAKDQEGTVDDSIAVVPVAMPLVAGPGAITTVVVTAHDLPTVMDKLLMSAVCAGVATVLWLALRFATPLSNRIGPQAVGITTRIMGIVLTAIAFGMMASGVKQLLPGLAK